MRITQPKYWLVVALTFMVMASSQVFASHWVEVGTKPQLSSPVPSDNVQWFIDMENIIINSNYIYYWLNCKGECGQFKATQKISSNEYWVSECSDLWDLRGAVDFHLDHLSVMRKTKTKLAIETTIPSSVKEAVHEKVCNLKMKRNRKLQKELRRRKGKKIKS